ncbi:hypothetical protein C2845_PM06G29790 [Panicum miliaceum]|uniref:Rx N-terminal domain-containing protein n=1 Tax=Panicum miliaceum TaxID=4540 RepID=A0A3L6RCL6_PANMI|nr:hypothetical protein C2845_PM06G29790 [Panicum miliaceum]
MTRENGGAAPWGWGCGLGGSYRVVVRRGKQQPEQSNRFARQYHSVKELTGRQPKNEDQNEERNCCSGSSKSMKQHDSQSDMLVGFDHICGVAEEVALQVGVEGDLGIIKDELELMQTYLMSTDEERSQHLVARVWARQVRDIAYDVEDCIEDSRIHLSDDSRSWRGWCSPSKILKRRRIANEERLYGPATATALPSAAAADPGPESSTPLLRRELEAAAAGVDLRKLLARRDKSLVVASICTSGTTTTSTTLPGEAYDALATTGRFRCRAWVTVQNPFNLGEFFRSLLRQIHVNSSPGKEQVVEGATVVDVQETIGTMSTQQLMSSVARNLGHRRYLLVLHGVSTRDEWDSIRLYLRPDVDNANRIIVTSQRDDVAKYRAGGQRSSSFWLSSGGALLSAFCPNGPPPYRARGSFPCTCTLLAPHRRHDGHCRPCPEHAQ